MTPMVDRTSVGVSQQQCAERTSLFVVPQHARVHFEEKPLNQILGLRLIPKYRISQAKYILPISVKENQKGFMVSFHDFAAQSLIGVRVKLFETVRSLPENHLYLSRTGSTNKRMTPKRDMRRQW